MRKIIFRAKNDDGEWLYGSLIDGLMGCVYIEYKDISKDDTPQTLTMKSKTESVDESTVGQYTGVDDKNNKPIYEGDIVRIHEDVGFDHVGVVVFKDGCFGVEYEAYKTKCFHPLYMTKDEWKEMNATIPINITFEVLGNIYNNRELLIQP